MELSDVAELQTLLEGVELPAEKPALVSYAGSQGAAPAHLGTLQGLPDREYDTIDEVAECLVRVQPEYADEVPHEPREESGQPPGGDDYTNPFPVSGSVRDKGRA
jgi:uncharacterized protein DUF2795